MSGVAIVVSRPTRWGNPFVLGQVCVRCGVLHEAPGSTLACFEEYARERLAKEPDWLDVLVVRELRCEGCRPGAKTCHARVLERLVQERIQRHLGGAP